MTLALTQFPKNRVVMLIWGFTLLMLCHVEAVTTPNNAQPSKVQAGGSTEPQAKIQTSVNPQPQVKAQSSGVVPQPSGIPLPSVAPQGKDTTTKQTKSQAKQQDPKCLQPLEPGPCRMSLERYYYNKQKNACETFKYGGCRGNDNRWGFRQTCEEACLI
ncbi:tissue factor pathway inhibitor [Scaptodrosophila lebanonensis]|uniref:Tissue factor pathway inhibitor n=1 Tax=Drosophila lebanonensis TaxID=7225 RepID=A0A6J2U896_DROLE|nr:tissue factor pathway inhibitor [Scaptodrosophila lebanonensis]